MRPRGSFSRAAHAACMRTAVIATDAQSVERAVANALPRTLTTDRMLLFRTARGAALMRGGPRQQAEMGLSTDNRAVEVMIN